MIWFDSRLRVEAAKPEPGVFVFRAGGLGGGGRVSRLLAGVGS